MAHAVYLGGGGSADDEALVWDEMLDGVDSVLYWPVALSGTMLAGAEAWLRNGLAGRPAVTVTSWLDLSEHTGESLIDFDLIFVGGGNTFDLQDRIRRAGFADPLRDFLAAGGSYYGGSAGAVLAGESIGIAAAADEDTVGSTEHSGLRLIADADLLPHFGPDWIDHATSWSAEHPDRVVIGIPEAAGIRCEIDDLNGDGRSTGRVRVIGPESVQLFVAGEPAGVVAAGQEFAVAEFLGRRAVRTSPDRD